MTPSEFKAWFDGFTEAFGNKLPTKAQWSRIKARVAEVDGNTVTEKRYYEYYHRYWPYYQAWGSTSIPCAGQLTGYGTSGSVSTSSSLGTVTGSTNLVSTGLAYDSLSAMKALGSAEAQSMVGA